METLEENYVRENNFALIWKCFVTFGGKTRILLRHIYLSLFYSFLKILLFGLRDIIEKKIDSENFALMLWMNCVNEI